MAVFLLVLYSYGKRFTDFPQVLLALAQFVAPVGAWLAVTGHVPAAAVALGIAVGTWIGGFDLDLLLPGRRDRPADRLAVVPGALRHRGRAARVGGRARGHGRRRSPGSARRPGSGWLWWTGVALTAAVLVYEHAIVRPDDLSRVNRAFFTANGVIGIGLFGVRAGRPDRARHLAHEPSPSACRRRTRRRVRRSRANP